MISGCGYEFRRKVPLLVVRDYLGRLEGKESRHEHFARLEQVVPL